jgi:tRNA G18 (ribose-2'-O)-methylase SpoU
MKKIEGEEILKKWRSIRPLQRFPIVAILDNIRSAYNVGSMFRTSACAYIEEIALCGITPYPPHPKLEKTALGTLNLVPWKHFNTTLDAIFYYKKLNYKIGIMEITDKSIPIEKISENFFPFAFVIGNEVEGVKEELFPYADIIFEIPLYGEKESLNVAVAFGIAVFFLIKIFFKNFSKI